MNTDIAHSAAPTAATARVRAGRLVVPLLLALAVYGQCRLFQVTTSITVDERNSVVMGLDAWWNGDVRAFYVRGGGPLPSLLYGSLPALLFDASTISRPESPMPFDVARILDAALAGVPLVLLAYLWLWRRHGPAAAAIGGTLLAFSPSVIAAAALANSDASLVLFSLLALAALARHQAAPSRGALLAVAGAVGLAYSAKYSGIFLFPIAGASFLVTEWTRAPAGPLPGRLARAAGRAALRLAAVGAATLAIAWALHGFEVVPALYELPPHPTLEHYVGTGAFGRTVEAALRHVWVPAPVKGFVAQISNMREHTPGCLFGRVAHHFWYYFPVVFAARSTPAELLLTAAAFALAWRHGRGRDGTFRLLAGSLALFGALAVLSTLNYSQRHLLLAYPLLVLCGIDLLRAATASRPRLFLAAGGALAAMQIVSAVLIAPHYLSYFNAASGGPAEGYRIVTEIDGGQDFPHLRRELARVGCRRVLFAGYEGLSPLSYGIPSVEWYTPDDAQAAACDWMAISLNDYYGRPLPGDPLAPFRAIAPSARAGYTIFLYDMRRPEARAALTKARETAKAWHYW